MGDRISSGMQEEIEYAKRIFIPILYVSEENVQEKIKIRQKDDILK